MKTLIVLPDTEEQSRRLKIFMKEFGIPFEIEKSTYDPEIVEKVLNGDKDLKAGKGVKLDIENLWE